MYSALTSRPLVLLAATLLVGAASALPAQTPVVTPAVAGANAASQAEALLREGRRHEATDLLGRWLAEHPTDGRAWTALGRVHLADAQRWHRDGHVGEPGGALLLDFATAAFEQSQALLADSGTVYRVLVTTERTVVRVEEQGWTEAMQREVPPEELPLPPVLAELGRNLIGSCAANGVLVTGSLVETAAVWGAWLQEGATGGLILVRPDLYAWDARYRVRMAEALGVPLDLDLPAALVRVAETRPICLSPAVDSITAPSLQWRPVHLVLTAGPASAEPQDVVVHTLARLGLAGSVWSVAARDVYELAARRNRALCAALRADEHPGLPDITACRE
jgi:hypothetical protein